MSSRSSSSRLPSSSSPIDVNPVIFPAGRARLGTRPDATGSPTATITRGTVVVAFLTAWEAGVPAVTITSTFWASSSPTRLGSRSYFPFRPSILDEDILAFDVTQLAQALAKWPHQIGLQSGG